MSDVEPESIRKKSPRRSSKMRLLYDNLPVAVYTCDLSGYVDYYNDAAIKLWGYEPEPGVRWGGAWKVYTRTGQPMTSEACPLTATLKTRVATQGEEII